MSVRITNYTKNGKTGWEVDIRYRTPEGTRLRERCKAPVTSKSGATRWAQDRERWLLKHGVQRKKKEVPTLQEFAPRFLSGYAVADGQKPSGVAAKETILRVHLIPAFGEKPLDAIRNEDVQRLKYALRDKSRKTVNNILTVLNVLLKKGMQWGRDHNDAMRDPTPEGFRSVRSFPRFSRVRTVGRSSEKPWHERSAGCSLGRGSRAAMR
jgi:hypothetical protein